jgi:hypothetical protein
VAVMGIFKTYIYVILQALILILSLSTQLYGFLVIAFIILLVVMTLDKMGKGIVLRELIAILYTFTCLLMPLVGYTYYTSNNYLARTWIKFMPVTEARYFEFALPAIVGFSLALTFPLRWREFPDEGSALRKTIQRIKEVLANKKKLSLYTIIIGVVVGRLAYFLPGGLQFFATLFFFGSFAGLLYVYYTDDFKFKKAVIGGFVFLILMNALTSGMFTIVAYMGITIISFFLLNSKPSFFKNVVIVGLSVFFILILQNTKGKYRQMTWRTEYSGSKIALFGKIFTENISKGGQLIEKRSLFPIYVRTNQGFNVAHVMRRIPAYQSHDNGINLLRAFASAFVPRFLWPDKPEAGGKFNMKYYAGLTIRGYSTNIGPLGEAYGSFGVTWGIVYMILLGAFIRWAYKLVFVIARKTPLIILWIPFLFYQITYSAENDTLQILNSFIKSAFFIFLLYKFVPVLFKPDQKPSTSRVEHSPVKTLQTS